MRMTRIRTSLPSEPLRGVGVSALRLDEVRLQVLVSPSLVSELLPAVVVARRACQYCKLLIATVGKQV